MQHANACRGAAAMDDAHAECSEGTWVRLLLRRALLVAGALGVALAFSTVTAAEAEAGPLDGLLDPASGTPDAVLSHVTDGVVAPVLDGSVYTGVEEVAYPGLSGVATPRWHR